jgi:membrane protease YdiL (CAAX protease family)
VVVPGLPEGERLVPSLAAILAQAYPGDLEILLVAGDATDDVLVEARILAPGSAVEARTRGGPARTWARGDVLVFLAPDAAIASDWLTSLVRPLADDLDPAETAPCVVLANGDGPPTLVDAETAAQLLGATDSRDAPGPACRALAIPAGLCRRLGGFEAAFVGALEDPGCAWGDAEARLGILLGGLQRPRRVPPPSTTLAPGPIVVVVLVALALAEVVTAFVDVRWGIAGHAVLLVLLAAVAALAAYRAGPAMPGAPPSPDRRFANFAAALALAPLIRITSLALPLATFPRPSWYAVAAVPVLAAAWAAARANGYGRQDIGLCLTPRPRAVAAALAVGLSGVVIGYVEYRILSPEPLIAGFAPLPFAGVLASLVFGTGVTEEVVFRGVLQRAAGDLLGVRVGIVYASAVFAILHIGHGSLLDVGFVFAVALGFALAVQRTRSLAGVIVAHGLTNVCLFVVYPLLLGGG